MALESGKSSGGQARPRRPKRWMVMAAVLAAGWLAQQAGIDLSSLGGGQNSGSAPPTTTTTTATTTAATSDAVRRIARAAEARESGFMVTVEARVEKVLPDDNKGSRHQRFLIELEDGRTLLVAHNIDLAKRLPLRENDSVRVRGQYEWNDLGGVLHWTHHDPDGSHPGGWIEHQGTRVE